MSRLTSFLTLGPQLLVSEWLGGWKENDRGRDKKRKGRVGEKETEREGERETRVEEERDREREGERESRVEEEREREKEIGRKKYVSLPHFFSFFVYLPVCLSVTLHIILLSDLLINYFILPLSVIFFLVSYPM